MIIKFKLFESIKVKAGDMIYHPAFGDGTVMSVRPDGEIAKIRFKGYYNERDIRLSTVDGLEIIKRKSPDEPVVKRQPRLRWYRHGKLEESYVSVFERDDFEVGNIVKLRDSKTTIYVGEIISIKKRPGVIRIEISIDREYWGDWQNLKMEMHDIALKKKLIRIWKNREEYNKYLEESRLVTSDDPYGEELWDD